MSERPETSLRALDFLKFAGVIALAIGLEAIVANVPGDVAFECWLFLCAGGLLWALIFGKRSIAP